MIFDKKIFLAFTMVCLCFLAEAQKDNRFTAQAMVGFNAAQIRGDALAGYDFFGLTAGFQVTYPIAERWDLGIELLYSNKGSQREMSFSNAPNLLKTSLDYLEVPIIAIVRDWYIEDERYYKVAAHAGFSFARLFEASSNNPLYADNVNEFKQNDFALIFGVSYNFTKRFAVNTRYSNSIINFYEDDVLETDGLINYLWNFTASYKL